MNRTRMWLRLLVAWPLLGVVSCATTPYQRLDAAALERSQPTTPPGERQFERGRPSVVLDSLGWAFGIPSKLILWDRRIDNHSINGGTEQALRTYLDYNRITDVKVRINEYAPHREFRRLVRNKTVGWGWRYTFGVVVWLYQAVLPGRLIGGDNYNPYTDTISLYSDAPAVSLHEGAHAKDFGGRHWKGTYAFAYMLPFITLYVEGRASNDAISYLYAHGSAWHEEEAYRLLYPAMGTYVGGTLGGDLMSPIYYAAVIPGHVVGRIKAAQVEDRRAWRPAVVPLDFCGPPWPPVLVAP